MLCLVTQLFLTLCDLLDWVCQAPLSMGILQARILKWVAMPSSRGSSQPRDWTQVSCITGRFCTVWATREAQEYWSGYPIPSSGDLPESGIELGSPALQVDSLPAELPGKPTHHHYFLFLRIISINIPQWYSVFAHQRNDRLGDHLIYYKGGKNVQWRKTISSISGTGKTAQLHVNECRTLPNIIHKINSK